MSGINAQTKYCRLSHVTVPYFSMWLKAKTWQMWFNWPGKNKKSKGASKRVNARGSARKNNYLIHTWELESLKHANEAVTALKPARKKQG